MSVHPPPPLYRLYNPHALTPFTAVGVTLVIYDWLLLFRIESQTIWPNRWTVPKVLYYFIRLVTLPFIVFGSYELIDFRPAFSKALCAAWPAMVTVPMFSTFAASNWLFTLRLVALYKRKRFVVWFMRIFYVLTYGATLSMLTAALIKYRETVDYFAQVKACGALEASPIFPAIFYAPAAYELLIFALTAHQAYSDASIITDSNSAPFFIALYRGEPRCLLPRPILQLTPFLSRRSNLLPPDARHPLMEHLDLCSGAHIFHKRRCEHLLGSKYHSLHKGIPQPGVDISETNFTILGELRGYYIEYEWGGEGNDRDSYRAAYEDLDVRGEYEG